MGYDHRDQLQTPPLDIISLEILCVVHHLDSVHDCGAIRLLLLSFHAKKSIALGKEEERRKKRKEEKRVLKKVISEDEQMSACCRWSCRVCIVRLLHPLLLWEEDVE